MLGGLLTGVTVCGVLMAIFQSNAGGAWDNAKKMFEEGVDIQGEKHYKGSDAHFAISTELHDECPSLFAVQHPSTLDSLSLSLLDSPPDCCPWASGLLFFSKPNKIFLRIFDTFGLFVSRQSSIETFKL